MPRNIELMELSKLKAATLLWRPARGGPVLTIVGKATFDLKPGVTTLSAVQDDVNERDLHKENNPKLGLHSASDMVPYKRVADVTVVGKAYAPPRELARSVVARLAVGSVDKRVEVHAQRYIRSNGSVLDEKFFSKMPLGYERAPGGPHTLNPVGRGLATKPDTTGRVPLPNLQVPGEVFAPNKPLTPIGFGPIPPGWPQRPLFNGVAESWRGNDWLAHPIPPDWDWSFFNVAPPDQRLEAIGARETVHLEHLHPEEPKLDVTLPGGAPCVFVEREQGAQRVPMRADTMWIDTNRLVLTVTWRGQVPLDDAEEKVRALVAMAEDGAEVSWDDVWQRAEQKREEAAVHSRRALKTAPQSPRGLTKQKQPNLTTPVQLASGGDHLPPWMPAPSSPGSSDPPQTSQRLPVSSGKPPASGGLVVELSLNDKQTDMLRELCRALGYDAQDTLRLALDEAYRARFDSRD